MVTSTTRVTLNTLKLSAELKASHSRLFFKSSRTATLPGFFDLLRAHLALLKSRIVSMHFPGIGDRPLPLAKSASAAALAALACPQKIPRQRRSHFSTQLKS